MTGPALLWLRDDLRVHDHEALIAACEASETVVAVWIREERADDEDGPRPLGAATRWWAHRSLEALRSRLAELNIPLVFARGRADAIIPRLARELGAGSVHWHRRYGPRPRALDARVKSMLRTAGVPAHSHPGFTLVEPWEVQPTTGADFYRVFTPFHRAARQVPVGDPAGPPAPRPDHPAVESGLLCTLDELGLLDGTAHSTFPHLPRWWEESVQRHWRPGCVAAAQALAEIDLGVSGYATSRDRPADQQSTTRLSPRLRFGELSPRQVVAQVLASADLSAEDREAFLRQVYWREFSWHLAYWLPGIETEPLRAEFTAFDWEPDEETAEAWRRGRTGIAYVDAGMNQLWQSGWMHNRLRMATASLLIKNLLQPWPTGEQWFWDTLVDADEASNPVSWQWVAGSGADAAPYFRIFNPERQAERFDPDGAYVRRWLPHRRVDEPLVDLKDSRREALARYQLMRARAAHLGRAAGEDR